MAALKSPEVLDLFLQLSANWDYTAVIHPIMTYGCDVFPHTKGRHLHRFQILQNRFLRKNMGAPWCIRNDRIHLNLKVPTIAQCYFDSAIRDRNPLIQAAAKYVPSQISNICRPRHTLITPDDPITIHNRKAVETQYFSKNRNRSYKKNIRCRRRGPSRRVHVQKQKR